MLPILNIFKWLAPKAGRIILNLFLNFEQKWTSCSYKKNINCILRAKRVLDYI